MSDIVDLLKAREEHEEGPFFGPDRLCQAAAAEIERLTAALAEARGLLGAFYRADIDPHKYDRTAQWLERNK